MDIPDQKECFLLLDDQKVYLSDSCGPCSAKVLLQQSGINIDIKDILSHSINMGWYIPFDRKGICTSTTNLLKIVENYCDVNKKLVGMNVILNEEDAFSFILNSQGKYSIIFLNRVECNPRECSHFVTLSSLEVNEEGVRMIECIDTFSHTNEDGQWEESPGMWKIPFSQFYRGWFSSPDGQDGWLLLLEK